MSNILNTLFHNTSEALRTKGGTSGTIKPVDYPTSIENLPSGGGLDLINVSEIKYRAGDEEGKFEALPAGLLVELQREGSIYYNITEELGSAGLLDTVLINDNDGDSKLLMVLAQNNDAIFKIFTVNDEEAGLIASYQYTISTVGYYAPSRVCKLDDDKFVVLSIYVGSDEARADDDNLCRIDIYSTDYNSAEDTWNINKIYTKDITISSIVPGMRYNNYYELGLSVQYYEEETVADSKYIIEFIYSSTGDSQDGDPFTVLVSKAVMGDFSDATFSNNLYASILGVSASSSIVGKPIDFVDVGNNRKILPIIDYNTGEISIYGIYVNNSNVHKTNKNASTFVTRSDAKVVCFNGAYFLIYNTDESTLYYSKLTITNTIRNGCLVTFGTPVSLYSSQDIFASRTDMATPTYNGNKVILTFQDDEHGYNTVVEVEYDEYRDSIKVNSMSRFGYNQGQMNSMIYLNEDTIIAACPIGDNYDIEINGVYIDENGVHKGASVLTAYPATETIDGITKTAAFIGDKGICYILDPSKPEPPTPTYDLDFNTIVGESKGHGRESSLSDVDITETSEYDFLESLNYEDLQAVCNYMKENIEDNDRHTFIIDGSKSTLTGEVKQISGNYIKVFIPNPYEEGEEYVYNVGVITVNDVTHTYVISGDDNYDIDVDNVAFNIDRDLCIASGLNPEESGYDSFFEDLGVDTYLLLADYINSELESGNNYRFILRSDSMLPMDGGLMLTKLNILTFSSFDGCNYIITINEDPETGEHTFSVRKEELPK